jgi:hypothetical protein
MFSLQQNQRTRGQNRFCLEERGLVVVGVEEGGREAWGRGNPNNEYTYK